MAPKKDSKENKAGAPPPKKLGKVGNTEALPSAGEGLADLIDPEKPMTVPRKAIETISEVHGDKRKLGPKERYFESPDGRIYIGPIDQPSIPDPLHHGREINPMRTSSNTKRA